MSTKKDMRRVDLVIPYQEPAAKEGGVGDLMSTLVTSLPMAAMFTRNKYLGWTSVIMAVQNWLSESPEQKATASQPAYMTTLMALLSLMITYMAYFVPPPLPKGAPAQPPIAQ